MSRLSALFNRLEARLQSLVEGTSARLFPPRHLRHELNELLVKAMHAESRPGSDGSRIAPDLYLLTLPSAQAHALQSQPGLIEQLSALLEHAGAEAGLQFVSPPLIRLQPYQGAQSGIHIQALHGSQPLEETGAMPPLTQGRTGEGLLSEPRLDGATSPHPQEAFLIVNGERIYPLKGVLVHIGRMPECDLVLDDPRVSRSHAQIRIVRGRYTLFDLGSTGGTFINGEQVMHAMLFPGDLISLAGVPLIYGEDDLPRSGETEEIPTAHSPPTQP
jgi:hypothetical protein